MVEVVIIYESKFLSDKLEELVPVKVLEGVYNEEENTFKASDGVVYENIHTPDTTEDLFASRIVFQDENTTITPEGYQMKLENFTKGTLELEEKKNLYKK